MLALLLCNPGRGIDAVSIPWPVCLRYKSSIAWGITTFDRSIRGLLRNPNKDKRLASTSANASCGIEEEDAHQVASNRTIASSQDRLTSRMVKKAPETKTKT